MRTMEVLTLKVALVAPAGTITLEGTLAALLLLESATWAPPAGAGPLSVTVLVVVAGLGLNDAVTPLGRPEADKLTLPLKPFSGVTVTVAAPPLPCVMLRLVGDAD